jgi:hypothetical protein
MTVYFATTNLARFNIVSLSDANEFGMIQVEQQQVNVGAPPGLMSAP